MNPALLAQLLQQMGALPSRPQSLQAPGMVGTSPLRVPTMRAEDPDFLQESLGPINQEQGQLQRQMAQAEALMQGSGRRAATPLGAAIGGLADVAGAFLGANRQENLRRQQRGLDLRRDEMVAQAGRGPSASAAVLTRALGGSGKAQKSTDVNSPASERARGIIRATLGDQFTEEEISQMTEADADNVLKYGSMKRGAEVAREGQVATTKRAGAALSQQGRIWAERRNLEYDKLSQEERLAADRLAAAESARGETQATDFGKTLATSGIPGAQAKIGELNTLFSKYPGDLPGIGLAAGAVPSRFVSEDAKRLRMLIGQLGADYQKSMTGAGASDAERARYDEVTGLLKRGDSDSIRIGVQMMAQDLAVKERAIEQSFPPEAVKKVKSRGKGNPPRAPAASVLPTDANGQPTLETTGLPPPPPGKVRIRINGKVGLIPTGNLDAAKAQGAVEVR